jgi:hypothetical protein
LLFFFITHTFNTHTHIDVSSEREFCLESTTCAEKCSLHGRCILNNSCSCDADFTGPICEQMTRNLYNGERQRGYVNNNQWNYYSYRSDTINSFVVQVTHDEGDCDVYINNVRSIYNIFIFSIQPHSSFSLFVYLFLFLSPLSYSHTFSLHNLCFQNQYFRAQILHDGLTNIMTFH